MRSTHEPAAPPCLAFAHKKLPANLAELTHLVAGWSGYAVGNGFLLALGVLRTGCTGPRSEGTVLSVRLRHERRRKPGRMAGRALLSATG
jgi:hypothetical protein